MAGANDGAVYARLSTDNCSLTFQSSLCAVRSRLRSAVAAGVQAPGQGMRSTRSGVDLCSA